MAVLAALAAQCRRAHLLPQVLASLRPQVDRLCVYLNGWTGVPRAVLDFADDYVVDAENTGAERKFHWADKWQGIYCSTDDDIVYPFDYVAKMTAELARVGGRAIVTAHGRTYLDQPRTVHQVAPASVGQYDRQVKPGRQVNHGGTGVMVWDAAQVQLPAAWPESNIADMQVAIWAQLNEVPMFLIAHEAHWFKPLAKMDPDGLFRASQLESHRRRSEMLCAHGKRQPWRLIEASV